MPPLLNECQDQLNARRSYGSTRNPVDLTGPNLTASALVDAATVLAEESTIDAVVVIMPTLSQRTGARLLKADSDQLTLDLAELQRRSEKPILMFSYAGVNEIFGWRTFQRPGWPGTRAPYAWRVLCGVWSSKGTA